MKPDDYNDKSFENFIADTSNQFALVSCKEILNSNETFNPLMIYGPSGYGKTHLLMAIKRKAETEYPEKKVGYFTMEELISDYLEKIRNKHTGCYVFGEKCVKYDVVLIDGIEDMKRKSVIQEELFCLINRLEGLGKKVVTACSISQKSLPVFFEKVMKMFESRMMCDIGAPSAELRLKYAKHIAEQVGLRINDVTIKLVAEKHSNLVEIQGDVLVLKLKADEEKKFPKTSVDSQKKE